MSSVLLHQQSVADLASQSVREWRAEILRKAADGSRPLTLFGRRQKDEVLLTAVLMHAGQFEILRTTVSAVEGYRALTADLPALHCFERELHEQTGIRLTDHPWLKPIRSPSGMGAYPYYVLEGKEVHEVAVGPVHAGVIEPGSFRFMCLGERVHHLEIQLGYQHRGVERLLLEKPPTRLAPLVETIAGDTSVAHAWAYAAAIESLAGLPVPMEEQLARAFALELERVAMHLAGLAGVCADIGFLQGATSYGRLRTTAINTTMRLCGSRFGRGLVRPGGGGVQRASASPAELATALDLLRSDLAIIDDCFLGARTVQDRLRGVGALTIVDAHQLGLVGPAARACGVPIDARHAAREGVYRDLPIQQAVLADGDCWARSVLRIEELRHSLSWLSAALPLCRPTRRPDSRPAPRPEHLAPGQIVISVVEGWRGEVLHCLETGPTGQLVHYKVQDPSLRNWMGLALAVRENEISDFPIVNKSFDLSYCGNDL